MRSHLIRHVALPAAAPIVLVALYFTPTSAIACATRGLLALLLVLASAAGAFVALGLGFREQRRGEGGGGWWIATASVFAVPLVLLLGPLG